MTPNRMGTGIASLNDFFGGGIAMPSTMILSSNPGAGKTTLMLQIAKHIEDVYKAETKVLFVSADNEATKRHRDLKLAANSTDPEYVKSYALINDVDLLIVDSLNSMRLENEKYVLCSARNIASDLIDFSLKFGKYKQRAGKQMTLILTCHHKTYGIANIENLIDLVATIKASKPDGHLRTLGAVKNRFASITGKFGFTIEQDGIHAAA